MRIALLGVGLIGGSIGLASQAAGSGEVAGYDSDPRALEAAVDRQAVTRAAAGIDDAVDGADAVFVCAPVGELSELVSAALAAAQPDCVVTDVGSTKRAIVAAHDDPRFVGGHPLAGAETAGVAHARADLFERATWYLTPTTTTSGLLYDRLYRLLRTLGAVPAAVEADAHDRMMAAVSHLPHVLANVLVAQAAGALGEADERIPAVGPSFRDATRVAGAPGAVWTDIYMTNADALGAQLDETIAQLAGIRSALSLGDRTWIESWNAAAAEHRRHLLEAGLAGGALCELRVSVPNRPGVVAEVALALGRAGVNIADMALHPAPDMSEGVVALWLAGESATERAQALLGELGLPVARA